MQNVLIRNGLATVALVAFFVWEYFSNNSLADNFQGLSFIFLLPLAWYGGIYGGIGAVILALGSPFIFQKLLNHPLDIQNLALAVLPGAIGLGLVSFFRLRSDEHKPELVESLRNLQILESGSLDISSASDPLGLTESAMNAIADLGIAEHTAFVRFREGKPVVVSSRGAMERYRGRHLPQQKLSAHASLSDSFTVGSYLEGIPESAGWSTAAVPVSARQNRPLGVLILARDGTKPFEQDEKALATSLARVMGAQLGQMEALKHLEDAYDGTLRALGLALEYRDHETQGHTRRVVAWADQLAQDLKLDASTRKYLRWGAYLHDIGKLAVPDPILQKPDKLTPEEWVVMKSHTTTGAEILSKVPFLPKETLDVVRHHHENWDGTGYPDQIKGEDIPVLARVFSIVDTFDALYSPRPYKKAWKPAEIIEELRHQRGKKFDPKLVDAFIARITSPSGAQTIENASPERSRMSTNLSS